MSSAELLYLPFENCSQSVGPEFEFPEWSGYLAAGIAVLFFGFQGWPIKRAKTGDGMFFQFFLCTGIWIVGLGWQFARNSAFEPVAMLGGALWCTGNVLTVPIVKTIGFSQGLLLWSTLNLAMGWLSGRFGLFGLQPDIIRDPLMNVFGAVLALISAVLFAAIKTTVSTTHTPLDKDREKDGRRSGANTPGTMFAKDLLPTISENDPLLSSKSTVPQTPMSALLSQVEKTEKPWVFDRLTPAGKRIIGVAMASVAGIFYGTNFDPPQYLQDHCCQVNLTSGDRQLVHSPVAVDYVFSHFTGIFFTSLLYLIIYAVVKKGKPEVEGSSLLLGILAGILWGVADSSWFIANGTLQFVIAFPLVCTGPSFVAAILGIFLFKEIQGKKNYIILAIAFLVAGGGIALIVVSR